MADTNIQSVAIIGSGIEGWMSAAMLATFLGPRISISVLDMPTPENSVTPATMPALKAFNGLIGIAEATFMSRISATAKLGTQFVNWGALGQRYFHPHGGYAPDFDVVALHHWWLKAKSANQTMLGLDDLSMAWGLAKENRFVPPSPDRRLIQASHDYGYHINRDPYRDELRGLALSRGVKEVSGSVLTTALDPSTGHLRQINLDTGATISADLFLDCSGEAAVLISGVYQVGFEDWSDVLPCNRMICAKSVALSDLPPYTRITQREAGWQWRSPLQDHTSTGYVYASDHLSDDDARATLLDNLDGRLLGEPVVTAFTNGRRHRAFHKNVIAIGAAAGFLEPLEATDLHIVQTALTRLLTLWPRKDCQPILAEAYNQASAADWDSARDFLALHYRATTRTDTPLWTQCARAPASTALQSRLDLWHDSARLSFSRHEVFQQTSWLSVLTGQGLMPQTFDPLVDARAALVDYKARLEGIARVIAETAPSLPLHREWISKNGRA